MEALESVMPRSDVQAPTARDRLVAYLAPGVLITGAFYHHVLTLLDVLFVQQQPSLLLDVPKLRDQAFSRFWLAFGATLSADMPAELAPLLAHLTGTVLDIGPGSGEQLHRYAGSASTVREIYGVEPAGKLHEKLRAKAHEAGLDGKYHVLGCGAEPESLVPALAKAGVLKEGADGVFDEIVSIRVLCGVPDAAETVAGLYDLLKPGGRLIVMEHVVARGTVVARALQAMYMWIGRWKFWMGGCCLDRDTGTILREAGAWSKVELKTLNTWSTIPQIVGYLVKK